MTSINGSCRCLSVSPILPTINIARTKAHYEQLGFIVTIYSDDFAMTARDDIELFFSLKPEHDPKKTAACIYVCVTDVDALHSAWTMKRVPGLRDLRTVEYGMRRFAYVDPDNNLILFGSRFDQKCKGVKYGF